MQVAIVGSSIKLASRPRTYWIERNTFLTLKHSKIIACMLIISREKEKC